MDAAYETLKASLAELSIEEMAAMLRRAIDSKPSANDKEARARELARAALGGSADGYSGSH